MTEWLDSDEGKSELLKFIDEMKIMSNRKTNRINPLLTKLSNSTVTSKTSNISYDDLVLFEEILSSEINKTIANQENNITKDTINKTVKIITQNVLQLHDQSWNSEPEDLAKVNEKTARIIQKPVVTKKIFDPQQLIERIRKSYDRMHTTPNYELLTCKSQSFLQRLAVLGEMLT